MEGINDNDMEGTNDDNMEGINNSGMEGINDNDMGLVGDTQSTFSESHPPVIYLVQLSLRQMLQLTQAQRYFDCSFKDF